MTTAPSPEFGTGLRHALEQRGALTETRAVFSALELLVRDEEQQPARSPLFAPRAAHAYRLAA